LSVSGVRGQQAIADRLARLEKIGPHRYRFQSGSFSNFGGRKTLQIDEIEDLALSLRQFREELANDGRRPLTIDTATGIGGVDIAQRTRRWCQRQTAASPARPTPLGRCPSGDSVQPRLERAVRAIITDLAMRADENFLGDVISFVWIAGKDESPAEDGGLKARHQGGERGIATRGRPRSELRIECPRRAVAVHNGRAVFSGVPLLSAETTTSHRQANIRLGGHCTRVC